MLSSTPAGPSRHPPSSSRYHNDRDRETATSRRAGTPPLPSYEPPIAPLTEPGRTALQALLRSQSLRHLKTHITHAEKKITDCAGEVNERLADAKMREGRMRARKEKEKERQRDRSRSMTEGGDGDGEGDADADAVDDGDNNESTRLRDLGESVEGVTGRLDKIMRRTIDSGVRVDGLVDILGKLQEEVEVAAGSARQQQRLRRRRRRDAEDDDGEYEDGVGLYMATPEPEVNGEEISLRKKLEQRVADDQAKWDDMTLTERYTKNNAYIGFYRMIHDAKHPGDDIPPVPHANTWFAHLEDPNAARKRRSSSSSSIAPARYTRHRVAARDASAESDDDVAIERERISLKCPLTLLPFRDPVTSTKCPHSFERKAITSMIETSAQTVPAAASSSGRGGRRIRAVKCPVCEVVLTNNDLREDPVLLRRVRRTEAAQRRREEDDDDDDDDEISVSGRRKSGRGIELGSDDEDGNGNLMAVDHVRIKEERARSVSQFAGGTQDAATESETGDSNYEDEE